MHQEENGVGAILRAVTRPTVLMCWLVATIVVALAGPFGTFESRSFLWRLAYWAIVIGVSIPIAFSSKFFWRQVLGVAENWRIDFLTIATLSLVMGPLVVGFNIWLVGAENYASIEWKFASVVTFFVGTGVIVIRHWMIGPEAPAVARDRLLDRIGAAPGARLARVSSDNHYIRILTDDRKEYRILMRLRDAVAEIDVEPGLCVHRSHWVALHQIAAIERQDGKELVAMPCGSQVPIGPKYRPDLVELGLIAA